MTGPRRWLKRLEDDLQWAYDRLHGIPRPERSRRASWLLAEARDDQGFRHCMSLYVVARAAGRGRDTSEVRLHMLQKTGQAPPRLAALCRKAAREAVLLEAAVTAERLRLSVPAWAEG
jgi:hypothetical protein